VCARFCLSNRKKKNCSFGVGALAIKPKNRQPKKKGNFEVSLFSIN
jgi:hypothetical protein